jgi:hypothetical protein
LDKEIFNAETQRRREKPGKAKANITFQLEIRRAFQFFSKNLGVFASLR